MRKLPSAVLWFLIAGVFLAQGCKSGSTTTGAAQQPSQSSGTQVASANLAVGQTAVQPNQPVTANREKPSDPFEGFVLGGSLQQTVDALKQRGFPTDAGCDDGGGGFEDCYSRKGMPGESDFELLVLHIKDAKLYAVEYVFPKDRYHSVLSALTDTHGTPFSQGGVTGWKIGTGYRIALDPKGVPYKGYRFPKAIIADVKTAADRTVEDAVNGRGRYAH